jgi:hypothetical protein
VFLEAPPGFPVVFSLYAGSDTLYLSMLCGAGGAWAFWKEGLWYGPGALLKIRGFGESVLPSIIPDGIGLIWAGRVPDGLVESLVHQLRDPRSLLLALSVMDS